MIVQFFRILAFSAACMVSANLFIPPAHADELDDLFYSWKEASEIQLLLEILENQFQHGVVSSEFWRNRQPEKYVNRAKVACNALRGMHYLIEGTFRTIFNRISKNSPELKNLLYVIAPLNIDEILGTSPDFLNDFYTIEDWFQRGHPFVSDLNKQWWIKKNQARNQLAEWFHLLEKNPNRFEGIMTARIKDSFEQLEREEKRLTLLKAKRLKVDVELKEKAEDFSSLETAIDDLLLENEKLQTTFQKLQKLLPKSLEELLQKSDQLACRTWQTVYQRTLEEESKQEAVEKRKILGLGYIQEDKARHAIEKSILELFPASLNDMTIGLIPQGPSIAQFERRPVLRSEIKAIQFVAKSGFSFSKTKYKFSLKITLKDTLSGAFQTLILTSFKFDQDGKPLSTKNTVSLATLHPLLEDTIQKLAQKIALHEARHPEIYEAVNQAATASAREAQNELKGLSLAVSLNPPVIPPNPENKEQLNTPPSPSAASIGPFF